MSGFEMSSADIDRCPAKSLQPRHYRPDGTCRHLPDPLVGRRVRLVHCSDPYTRLTPGQEGTVSFVDSLGTVFVKWDDGHSLGLVADDGDRWQVLDG